MGLPADCRSQEFPSRIVQRIERHHARELAAERLLAGTAARHGRDSRASRTAHCPREGPEPFAPVLASDGLSATHGKTGWKGLRLRPDLVGTRDGLAKAPYIRESRRIKAEFTVLEQHVGTAARRKKLGKTDVEAEPFPDRVGVGSYRIDLHPSTGGVNYIDISSLPFQVPLAL